LKPALEGLVSGEVQPEEEGMDAKLLLITWIGTVTCGSLAI
jgi:hypothetical protein